MLFLGKLLYNGFDWLYLEVEILKDLQHDQHNQFHHKEPVFLHPQEWR